MGKSSKKSALKVAKSAIPELPTKQAKKGKRDAEEAIAKEVKVKKQKTELMEVVTKQKDVKKSKASKEPPTIKKPDSSSSDELASYGSEEVHDNSIDMGKSSKKSAVKVATSAIPELPPKQGKKGKRHVEEAIAKEVKMKKQKTELMEVVTKQKDVKKSKASKGPPTIKKPDSGSSDELASSGSEEDSIPVAVGKPSTRVINKDSSSDKDVDRDCSSEEGSDEEPSKAAQTKKAPTPVFKPSAKVAKKASSRSEESSSDGEPPKAEQKKKAPTPVRKPSTKVRKEDISSDDEDSSSDESSYGEPTKTEHKKAPVPVAKPSGKVVKKDSSSDEDNISEESSDDEPSKMKLKKIPVALNAARADMEVVKKDRDDKSSEESSDESSDEEPSKDTYMKVKDAPSLTATGKHTAPNSEKKGPKTPASVHSQSSGSKTLFVGNLSYNADKDEVAEFFKDAGEIVDVRLSTAADGSLKGFAHVEFATVEAVQKAFKMNNQQLLGRPVRLNIAQEKRGSYTPHEGKDNSSYQKGESHTIFIRGFDKSLGEDEIRSSLEEHFGSCGEIARVSIPEDRKTNAPKGIAYVFFNNKDSSDKALQLNGSKLGGYTLKVDPARPKGENRVGGGGGRDGGGRSWGRGRDGRGRGQKS